jgi:hypothetical protein
MKNINELNETEIHYIKGRLRTIGISTFLKYYTDFEGDLDQEIFIIRFKDNGEKWKFSSQKTKISSGRSIFRNNYQEYALDFIMHHTKKIDFTLINNLKSNFFV